MELANEHERELQRILYIQELYIQEITSIPWVS